MSKEKSLLHRKAEEAEIEENFLQNPGATPPFISLSTYVILASEQIARFQEHHDLEAGEKVKDLMDCIIQEANNVKIDVVARNFKGV
jgi:hypothetical protein